MAGIEPAVVGVAERSEGADVDHAVKMAMSRRRFKCQRCYRPASLNLRTRRRTSSSPAQPSSSSSSRRYSAPCSAWKAENAASDCHRSMVIHQPPGSAGTKQFCPKKPFGGSKQLGPRTVGRISRGEFLFAALREAGISRCERGPCRLHLLGAAPVQAKTDHKVLGVARSTDPSPPIPATTSSFNKIFATSKDLHIAEDRPSRKSIDRRRRRQLIRIEIVLKLRSNMADNDR